MLAVASFLIAAIATGMAVTPAPGDEPVRWQESTTTGAGPMWDVTLSNVQRGCARADIMAGTGVVETLVASCRPEGPSGRIQIEPLAVGDDQLLLARIEHGDRPMSTLVLLGFLCNRIVRVDLGDDRARVGAQYGMYPGAFPRFDRYLSTDRDAIQVFGPNEVQRYRVNDCSIERTDD